VYPWPGNVRELAHELERAVVFTDAEGLSFDSLAVGAAEGVASRGLRADEWFNEAFVFPEDGFSLDAAIDRLTRHALAQAEGNVSAAARLLGVSRDVVRYRLDGRKTTNDGKS
jgi:DNA-binding NtrC family response regulator